MNEFLREEVKFKVWQILLIFLIAGTLNIYLAHRADMEIATLSFQIRAYQFSEQANAKMLNMSLNMLDIALPFAPDEEKGREIMKGIIKAYQGSQEILTQSLNEKL